MFLKIYYNIKRRKEENTQYGKKRSTKLLEINEKTNNVCEEILVLIRKFYLLCCLKNKKMLKIQTFYILLK